MTGKIILWTIILEISYLILCRISIIFNRFFIILKLIQTKICRINLILIYVNPTQHQIQQILNQKIKRQLLSFHLKILLSNLTFMMKMKIGKLLPLREIQVRKINICPNKMRKEMLRRRRNSKMKESNKNKFKNKNRRTKVNSKISKDKRMKKQTRK